MEQKKKVGLGGRVFVEELMLYELLKRKPGGASIDIFDDQGHFLYFTLYFDTLC